MFNLNVILNNKLYKAKITRIYKERKNFENVDKEGNEVETEYKRAEVKYFIKKNGRRKEIVKEDVYKLINNVPRRKLKKTKEINNLILVEPDKLKEMIIEDYYLMDCESLRKYLIKEKKIIETAYSNGNGFKIYNTYITPYKNWLIMVLGFGKLDEEIENILEDYMPKEEADKRNDSDGSGIERVNEEELLSVYQD